VCGVEGIVSEKRLHQIEHWYAQRELAQAIAACSLDGFMDTCKPVLFTGGSDAAPEHGGLGKENPPHIWGIGLSEAKGAGTSILKCSYNRFPCVVNSVDDLLGRNLQTALKLTNAALQKHKDNQLLCVLKALALARLDKADEAYKAGSWVPFSLVKTSSLTCEPGFPAAPWKRDCNAQVCDGVVAEAPTDEQVLNILSMVYKGSEQASKLIAAYEAAVKARPYDRHLLHVLLMANVRYAFRSIL
jgi:hypothetical protein